MSVLNPLLLDYDKKDPPESKETDKKPSKECRISIHEEEELITKRKITKIFCDRKSACKDKIKFCIVLSIIISVFCVSGYCIFGYKPIPSYDSNRTLKFNNTQPLNSIKRKRVANTQLCVNGNTAYGKTNGKMRRGQIMKVVKTTHKPPRVSAVEICDYQTDGWIKIQPIENCERPSTLDITLLQKPFNQHGDLRCKKNKNQQRPLQPRPQQPPQQPRPQNLPHQPQQPQQSQPEQIVSQGNVCSEINRNEYRFSRTAGVAVELSIGVELKFAETINNAGLVVHTGKVVSFNKDLQLITLRYTEQLITKPILITFKHAKSMQSQLILPSNLPQFITHDPLGQLRKGMEVYVTTVNNEKIIGSVQVLNHFCKTALLLLNNPTNNAIFVVRSYAELKTDNTEIEIGGVKSNDRQDDCAPAKKSDPKNDLCLSVPSPRQDEDCKKNDRVIYQLITNQRKLGTIDDVLPGSSTDKFQRYQILTDTNEIIVIQSQQIVKCESPSEQTHSQRQESVDSAIDVCGDSDDEQQQQPQQQQQQENTTPESEDEEGEEEMVVPNPIDSSKYFNTIPNYGPGTPMNNVLNEIHTDIYFVYALYLKDSDGNISTPFYIGVTDNPYVRYYFHLKINSEQLDLKIFIQAHKENIVMRVLYGGKMEECLFVETLYIKFNTQLQYNLMNIRSGSARTPPLFNCNPVNSLNDLIIYSIDNGNDVTPDNNKAPPTTILPFFTLTPNYPISFKNLLEEIVKMEHYLYILADIDEYGNIIKIIYVGITYLPELRLYQHFKYCKTSTSKYCIYIRQHTSNMKMLVIHSNNRPMISLFERCILKNQNSIKFAGLNLLNTCLYSTVTIPKCGNVNEWASSLLSHAILNSKRISKNEATSAPPEVLERQNTKRRQNAIGILPRRLSSYAEGDMDTITNVWKNTQSMSAALATDLSKKTSLSTMELKTLFSDARAGKVSWLQRPSKLTPPTSNAGKPKCFWTEKNVKLMEDFFCKYIKSGKYTRLQVTTKKREMEMTTGETALRISTWIKHRQSNAYNRQIKYC